MLAPDVTELLTDPDLGGGISMNVTRKTFVRVHGMAQLKSAECFGVSGNVQPAQPVELQQMADEDKANEILVIRSSFAFQSGKDQGASFVAADEVDVWGRVWRVFKVEDWNPWGFTIAYITRMEASEAEDA